MGELATKNKLLLSVLLSAMMVSSFVLVTVLFTGTVQAAESISGIIDRNTTWTALGGPYTLAGNTLVANGVTLTIQPGTTVNLGSYYIQVNGTLIARGSSDNQIRFNSGSITFTTYCSPWNEQTGSGCIIENAVLTSTALSSDQSLKVNHCTIKAGITVDSSTIISNNNIEGSVSGGVVTGNVIKGDVNSANIFSNLITGSVGCTGNASNNVIKGGMGVNGNCRVTNNSITGDLTGNGISMNSPYVYGGGHPVVENNLVTNCLVGISIDVLIRDWFAANIPLVQNNEITYNEVGIQYSISVQESYSGEPTMIQNNNIKQNDIGIKLVYSFELCRIVHNNIEQNTNYSLYLDRVSFDVNATDNWWGTTDQQAISQTIYDYNKDFNLGRVNFVPFSNSPNPVSATPKSTPVSSTPTPIPSSQQTNPTPSIPEFPCAIVVTTVFAVTVLGGLLHKRKITKQ